MQRIWRDASRLLPCKKDDVNCYARNLQHTPLRFALQRCGSLRSDWRGLLGEGVFGVLLFKWLPLKAPGKFLMRSSREPQKVESQENPTIFQKFLQRRCSRRQNPITAEKSHLKLESKFSWATFPNISRWAWFLALLNFGQPSGLTLKVSSRRQGWLTWELLSIYIYVYMFMASSQETPTLRFRSFLGGGTYGLALVNQMFDSNFCLAGVPLRMMFANYESTFSKHEWTRIRLQIHSAKLRKGAWLQPEPHLKITNPNFPTTNRDFQTTIGGPRPGIFRPRTDQKSCYETKIRVGKGQPRNYEARGRTVRCAFTDTPWNNTWSSCHLRPVILKLAGEIVEICHQGLIQRFCGNAEDS